MTKQTKPVNYLEVSMILHHLWAPFYNDQIRKYHNEDHIHNMLEYAKEFEVDLSIEETIAILFHDAVYIPILSSELEVERANEKASVAVVKSLIDEIEGAVGKINLTMVESLIMSTADHTKRNSFIGDNIVVDLDLYCACNNYETNTANIKAEYKSLTDYQWVMGRCEFLKKMITADDLFQTETFEPFTIPYKEVMFKEFIELSRSKKTLQPDLYHMFET